MNAIHFATTNHQKLANAQHVCAQAGIELVPVSLDIDEIQSEDSRQIISHKVKTAYLQYGSPIVVSDDTWAIKALQGFPGAYMKSMNHWFTPADFLKLLDGVSDRRVELHQHLAYYDGERLKLFNEIIQGEVLLDSYGDHTKAPWMNVVTMAGDGGKSLAEVFNGSPESIANRYLNRPEVWAQVTTWYASQIGTA